MVMMERGRKVRQEKKMTTLAIRVRQARDLLHHRLLSETDTEVEIMRLTGFRW